MVTLAPGFCVWWAIFCLCPSPLYFFGPAFLSVSEYNAFVPCTVWIVASDRVAKNIKPKNNVIFAQSLFLQVCFASAVPGYKYHTKYIDGSYKRLRIARIFIVEWCVGNKQSHNHVRMFGKYKVEHKTYSIISLTNLLKPSMSSVPLSVLNIPLVPFQETSNIPKTLCARIEVRSHIVYLRIIGQQFPRRSRRVVRLKKTTNVPESLQSSFSSNYEDLVKITKVGSE